MVDINVVSERLKQLSLRIAKIRALCPAGLEGLTGDALDLVSFNLWLSSPKSDRVVMLPAEHAAEEGAARQDAGFSRGAIVDLH